MFSSWLEMFGSFELEMKNQSGKTLKANDDFEILDSKLAIILSEDRPCASELSSLNVCKCLTI